ncbi:hypothetical protein RB653_002049 [Dictyostelium firmibasis]|uniref:Uncharacterized protein n=1 Tax=Dictyostelium firmibasis TaxID=79012 RepID=A0AAN7YPP7_9MYCE
MKLFTFLILLFCVTYILAFKDSNSSSESSESSNESHYIYAFEINTEIGSNQYFIVIDPSENKIVKNVSINIPNEFIINGILGMDQQSNSLLLYADSYSSSIILSLDINSNEVNLYDQKLLSFKGKYPNQPIIYQNDAIYMAIETSDSRFGLVVYDYLNLVSKFYNFGLSNFSTTILPLTAFDSQNQLFYVTYSPISSNQTNLLVIDNNLANGPSVVKQFTSIKGLEVSSKNSMLLTSPNGTYLYLIQSNNNNNGMDMCQFDLTNNICNNVFSAQMIKNYQNSQFNPFQLSLDKSSLIVTNYVKSDKKGDMLTEVSIIDLDSLFPVASYTINNYFNSSNPSIQYFFSYL